MATSSKSRSERRQEEVFAPEMQVTRYDQVSSGLIATVLGLAALMGILTATWLMNRPDDVQQNVPIELIELPGGVEDGAIDETLLVESPEDPIPDAAPEQMEDEIVEVEEVFESLTELAEVSAEQLVQQVETDAQTSGEVGSREGTGRRARGLDSGQGGLPPEQRWYIQFGDERDLDEYARQLDFFGIELGAIMPDGRLIYLLNLAAARPTQRESRSGASEARLYMSWQGGKRQQADAELFRKAGLDVKSSRILHFYPLQTERLLATLEQQYANRTIAEIRRTYFLVESDGDGYQFRVTRQSTLQ
ncbi:hypothetical protein [Rubinisphaera sp. JC750]|uniref:hypothetical protein n=1 Tax=Rubinisphaera sp. JC750 TaxID=2898658 RepID=UPI001F158DB1|nr:hypothetical protein [Rubinisphaera sp. JC750]